MNIKDVAILKTKASQSDIINDATPFAGADIAAIKAKTDLIGLGGSGEDGNKTVAASENIAPAVWHEYQTLTIDAGQTLGLTEAGRMILRCTGKVTINGSISVLGKGSAGGAATACATPGNVGVSENNGGLVSGGGGGGGGGRSVVGGQAGGAGGGSSDTGCGAGGAGGAPATIGLPGSAGVQFSFIYEVQWLLHAIGKFMANLGSGGGSGGGGGTGTGTCGGGGKGGNSGGNILIIAPEIEIGAAGSIIADGDIGDNGSPNPAGDAGAGGGGGGGSGGNILLITRKFTNAGAANITALGRAGGTGGTSVSGQGGGAGAVGKDGVIKVMLV